MNTWKRDRLFAIISITTTALSLSVIGLAPSLAIETAGLLLVALGSCAMGFVMSLVGTIVQSDQVSSVYSLALTLSMVMRSITAPAASALFVGGMKLGLGFQIRDPLAQALRSHPDLEADSVTERLMLVDHWKPYPARSRFRKDENTSLYALPRDGRRDNFIYLKSSVRTSH